MSACATARSVSILLFVFECCNSGCTFLSLRRSGNASWQSRVQQWATGAWGEFSIPRSHSVILIMMLMTTQESLGLFVTECYLACFDVARIRRLSCFFSLTLIAVETLAIASACTLCTWICSHFILYPRVLSVLRKICNVRFWQCFF